MVWTDSPIFRTRALMRSCSKWQSGCVTGGLVLMSLVIVCSAIVSPACSQSCDAGWRGFSGRCYKFFIYDIGTWRNARRKCQRLDAEFVTVQSEEHNRLLSKLDTEVWLGAVYRGGSLNWTWPDGWPAHNFYTNWHPGHPVEGNGYCMKMANGLWNQTDCDDHLHYVCEKGAC